MRLLLILILGLFNFGLFSQQVAYVKGQVLEADTNTPIEFATISIFEKNSAKLIGGGITEMDGSFNLETQATDSYLKIDYISFETKSIDIQFDKKVLDLGTIKLKSTSINLEGVEVVAQKSTSQFLLDKKVFNVGNDIASKGGNAQDVLENVPSITVDLEGNVALRGSGNVRMLINGKPSGLLGISGTGGLRNIQANQIEKIEVITNPSARYDAEGSAGIINIVLKKDQDKGFSGSFEITGGAPLQLGSGANVNYRRRNLNFFLNYGINQRNSPGSGALYTEFYNEDTTLTTDLKRTMDRSGMNQSVRTGLDIYLPKKQTLTLSFTYGDEDNDNKTTLEYRDITFINQNTNRALTAGLSDFERRIDQEIELESKIEGALDYKIDLPGEDHQLTATFQYQNNGEKENSDLNNTFFIENQYTEDLLTQRSSNEELETQILLQADYIKPIDENAKFELGFRSNLRDINNNYLVETLIEDIWTNEVGLSNDFQYDENVHAGYAIYGNNIDRFSYQVGTRAEYSDISTFLITSEVGYDTLYLNLFPSGFLSYEFNPENQIQVSYSRRIRRPRFRELNPFFTFSDNRNFYSGNPFLRPEFTDSYEIGFLKYWGQSNFNTSFYFRKVKDNIIRIKEVDTDGTSNTAPRNLGFRNEMGMEFLYGIKYKRWLKVDAELNVFESKFYGEELPDEFKITAFNYNARLNTRFTTESGYDFQIRSNYRGPRDTPQGRRRSILSVDLGISKDFLNNDLTLSFNVRDVFNSRRWNYERFDDTFYEDGEFQWRRNSAALNLSYRINAKKQRPSGQNGGYDGGEF